MGGIFVNNIAFLCDQCTLNTVQLQTTEKNVLCGCLSSLGELRLSAYGGHMSESERQIVDVTVSVICGSHYGPVKYYCHF